MRGLLYYLFTEGRAGEKGLDSDHKDPRVIAGWDNGEDLAGLQPPLTGAGQRDFGALASRLNEPLLALGLERAELKRLKPVYHLAISAAKDPKTGELVDPLLSDEQWADIAREYMDRIGLARRGQDTGVRWVAVRHADDHVHVVATLARQDGRRPRLSNDRYRSCEASRFVEGKYGLRSISGAGGAGAPAATRGEQRKHQATARRRRGQGLPGPSAPDREVLRRHVRTAAAGAGSLAEFFDRLRADGLLVRQRMSERNPGEITGYAVALPDRYDSGGRPIFFGGGKLAPDLTVPRLLRRWPPPAGSGAERIAPDPGPGRSGREPLTDRFGLTALERLKIWKQATIAATKAGEQIAACAGSDPAGAADAAWAASDFLAAAGRVVDGRRGGPLTAAATEYDQAARELFGRPPAPTAAGQGLRAAGRLLLSAQVAQPSELKQLLALLAQLAALADAVTRLRESQQRAAQAAAARTVAEQLRLVAAGYQPDQPGCGSPGGPGRAHPASGRRVTVPAAAESGRGPQR